MLRAPEQFIRNELTMPKQARTRISPKPTKPYSNSQFWYFGVSYTCPSTGKRKHTRISTQETDQRKAQALREDLRDAFIADLSKTVVSTSNLITVDSLITEFLESKFLSCTEKSYDSYWYDLARFKKYAFGKTVKETDARYLEKFLGTIKGKNTDPQRSSAAQQKMKRSLSALFGIAVKRGYTQQNPVLQVTLKKPKDEKRDCFTDSEFKAFWIEMPEESYLQRVVKSLTLLSSATGGRLFELATLKLADIDLTKGAIQLRNTKNGKSRELKVNDRARQAIALQLTNKASHKCERVRESRLLFPNSNGDKLISNDRQTNPISYRFKKIRASILPHREGIHFHSIRHSFAQNAANVCVPIMHLSKYIGHSDIATTMRYVKYDDLQLFDHEIMDLKSYIDSLGVITYSVQGKIRNAINIIQPPSEQSCTPSDMTTLLSRVG